WLLSPWRRFGLAPATVVTPATSNADRIVAGTEIVPWTAPMPRLSRRAPRAHRQVDLDVSRRLYGDAGAIRERDHLFVGESLDGAAHSELRGGRTGLNIADPPGRRERPDVHVPRPVNVDRNVGGGDCDARRMPVTAKREVKI